MGTSTGIVVIDPHPIFREGVVRTIARSEGMSIVGEGKTAADARRLAGAKTPDIMIIDIAIAGARKVIAEVAQCGIKCVILTALDDTLSVSNALAAGASGYILKGVSGLELIAALNEVHAGKPYVTAELASRVLVAGSLLPQRKAKVAAGLSYREQQVLDHITKGYTNREIAAKLGLTVGTTKFYLTRLFKKMRVRSRLQAVIAARSQTPGTQAGSGSP
jgi:DNA-binding NarL/FixJ family response regulator